jgi:antitoxin component YwqK of YwqJK toxin-antitoxin module
MTSFTIKYFLLISFNAFFSNCFQAVNTDTSKYYYKVFDNGFIGEISGPKYADFYRLVITPDSADANYIVEDFYNDGHPKFRGTYKRSFGIGKDGKGTLDGPGIGFFENGKTSSDEIYSNGLKSGLEHLYFPDGKLYAVYKYDEYGFSAFDNAESQRKHFIDCYEDNGISTCIKGNGQWRIYDSNFKSIILKGTVKNGHQDGEWTNDTFLSDSVKYTYAFKKGEFIGGTGFDKAGHAYPFRHTIENADCKIGMNDFLVSVQRSVKFLKGTTGSNIDLQDVELSFIIEPSGQLTELVLKGTEDAGLSETFTSIVVKAGNWAPHKHFGIPMRTQITVPLENKKLYTGYGYVNQTTYQEKVLGF